MVDKGQYDTEYKQGPCFWGTAPSKYVKLIEKYLPDGKDKKALDIGAGEGKNSFFLAEKGFDVTANEISLYAIKNFINEYIRRTNEGFAGNINIVLSDAEKWLTSGPYDLIVSYGMLHCLKSKENIFNMVDNMKKNTNKNGLNIICTFVKGLPVPDIQSYLEPTFLSSEEIKGLYSDWEILDFETDILEHTHPTSKVQHKHSLCRLIAKKP